MTSRTERTLGVGVLGLHEGRTLLVALNHVIPPPVGLTTGTTTRAPHARAVAGCDLSAEKIAGARRDCPELFYTQDYAELLARRDVDIVAIYTPDQVHGEHIVGQQCCRKIDCLMACWDPNRIFTGKKHRISRREL